MARDMTYLDYQATTPLAPEALAAMLPWLKDQHANPHSAHRPGRAAKAAVEVARDQVAALMARLESVGEQRSRTDKAPIRRSMGNLRVALQDRLSKGEFSDETLHDVAALIDEVAQKIERLR